MWDELVKFRWLWTIPIMFFLNCQEEEDPPMTISFKTSSISLTEGDSSRIEFEISKRWWISSYCLFEGKPKS